MKEKISQYTDADPSNHPTSFFPLIIQYSIAPSVGNQLGVVCSRVMDKYRIVQSTSIPVQIMKILPLLLQVQPIVPVDVVQWPFNPRIMFHPTKVEESLPFPAAAPLTYHILEQTEPQPIRLLATDQLVRKKLNLLSRHPHRRPVTLELPVGSGPPPAVQMVGHVPPDLDLLPH